MGKDRVSKLIRFRLDHLRRHTLQLVEASGVTPPRATTLVDHLLWFDAVGASGFGIATLPHWLERIAAHEFDPAVEGRVVSERNGTAVIDGYQGLPPVVLRRAAEVAIEKARDAGVGLVAINRLGPTGPAAGVAADVAIGPWVAWILGPGPSWALALPSDEGLPAVYDSALAAREAPPGGPAPASPPGLIPWISVLAPEGGWLLAAVSVAAWEPLPRFHARVRAALGGGGGDGDDRRAAEAGQLRPEVCEVRRRDVREQGVPMTAAVVDELIRWGQRLGVAPLALDPHR